MAQLGENNNNKTIRLQTKINYIWLSKYIEKQYVYKN